MKLLIYSHPSVPQKGIELNKTYALNELTKDFSFDLIKCLFSPVNFKWDELNKKPKLSKDVEIKEGD